MASSQTRVLKKFAAGGHTLLEPSILEVEQSNTSLVYGNQFILKLFRRLQDGINPDLDPNNLSSIAPQNTCQNQKAKHETQPNRLMG